MRGLGGTVRGPSANDNGARTRTKVNAGVTTTVSRARAKVDTIRVARYSNGPAAAVQDACERAGSGGGHAGTRNDRHRNGGLHDDDRDCGFIGDIGLGDINGFDNGESNTRGDRDSVLRGGRHQHLRRQGLS